nr:Fic family protein [Tissierella sp.]
MKDPYLYPNTDILINKFNIKDEDTINSLEADFSSSRLKDIIQEGVEGDFDLEHLMNVHYIIFQDIYDWSGQTRTIDIEKSESLLGGISIEYSKHQNIEKDIKCVLSDMKSIKWIELGIDDIAELFSKYLSQLWKVHPFREGNTRTIITFCSMYAEKQGFKLDTDLLKDNSNYVRTALVASNAIFDDLGDKSNTDYIIKIIKDAIKAARNIQEI